MKKLQMNDEHRALIETVVKAHPKYKGNEVLLDVFCETIYKKSYLLIDAIKDFERLKRHLETICDNCMELILYDKIKADTEIKNKESIVSVKKTPLIKEPPKPTKKEVISLKQEIQKEEFATSSQVLIDPLEYYPRKEASEKTIEKLIQIVKKISSQHPKKRYYEIFVSRYIKGLDHTQTAYEMKISQAELSKRFVELIKLTRDKL